MARTEGTVGDRTMIASIQESSFSASVLGITILVLTLSGCAQTPTRSQYGSIDDVIANVRDPAMKKVWLDAQAANTLPPVSKIPAPDNPVSQRQVVRVGVAASKPKRPVIPDRTVITVEPFSEEEITSYNGRFEVISHEAGVLQGRLRDQTPLFEIFYKLPGGKQIMHAQRSAVLNLTYRDDVLDNALQRRIVLRDPETSRTLLVAIAEGSHKPYRTEIKEIGLVIEQASEGENPPVTVRYAGQSVVLRQGEAKVIAKDKQQLRVHLLNSYAQ